MRASTFVLSDLQTGQRLGHALICVEAKYASVAWVGETRLDRRVVEPGDWRMMLLALEVHLPPGILPTAHIVQTMLVPPDRRKSIAVQYVAELPIDVEPEQVVERLDRMLRDVSAPER